MCNQRGIVYVPPSTCVFLFFFFRLRDMVKVLTIYLREDTFVPGKKNYERARKCLEENLNDTFDVIVAWDPPGNIFYILFFTTGFVDFWKVCWRVEISNCQN